MRGQDEHALEKTRLRRGQEPESLQVANVNGKKKKSKKETRKL